MVEYKVVVFYEFHYFEGWQLEILASTFKFQKSPSLSLSDIVQGQGFVFCEFHYFKGCLLENLTSTFKFQWPPVTFSNFGSHLLSVLVVEYKVLFFASLYQGLPARTDHLLSFLHQRWSVLAGNPLIVVALLSSERETILRGKF